MLDSTRSVFEGRSTTSARRSTPHSSLLWPQRKSNPERRQPCGGTPVLELIRRPQREKGLMGIMEGAGSISTPGTAPMTSPFPGMDPYLEQHWGDVHSSLIIYARDQLRRKLPGDLRARVEERVFVESFANDD